MITFETTELVFDFATLFSIIGAGAVLIYTTSRENKKNLRENKKNLQKNLRENKKNLQNEKVVEIWELLIEFNKYSDELREEIGKKGNVGLLFPKMAKFLRVKMLPTFAIFSTQENIDALVNMMNETEIVIDVWSDKNARNAVTKAMSKYINSMIDLDVQLTENLRNQVHNENENENKEIAKLYKKLKYTYREVEFK